MKFKNFSLRAEPIIQNAYCSNCRNLLIEVPNGLISPVWYCEHCENVYALRLIKVPGEKVSERFLKICREKTRDKK